MKHYQIKMSSKLILLHQSYPLCTPLCIKYALQSACFPLVAAVEIEFKLELLE